MKLSISNLAWDQARDKEVYSLLYKYGYTGFEIAPTKVFPEPYENLSQAKSWAERIKKEYGFSISSMQSIWYGVERRIIITADGGLFFLLVDK